MEDSPSEADRAKGAVVGPTFQCIIGGRTMPEEMALKSNKTNLFCFLCSQAVRRSEVGRPLLLLTHSPGGVAHPQRVGQRFEEEV